MFDVQIVKNEIARLKQLRADYDKLNISPCVHEAMEAYRRWYEESVVVFGHYFDDNNKEFVDFKNIDNNVDNGHVLKANYQNIRKDFCVLLDKLERGDIGGNSKVSAEKLPTKQLISGKRIFISHASKDRELVSKFVDSIILLGMGLESKIIAYTSRDDTGVIPGESIPQFIQNNMACADIVLLIISDNYKKSEVCLNEMGAAWALNRHIIQILLPNTSFDKLGWLESLNKAIKIDCNESIDTLCEVFSDKLGFVIKPSVWNRNKDAFISYCRSLSSTLLPSVMVSDIKELEDNEIEELGFLDYREQVDINVQTISEICCRLTDAMHKHTESLKTNTRRLQNINSSHPNISQARGVMQSAAKGMDDLSKEIEDDAMDLRDSFFRMIDNATKMKALIASENKESMNEEYAAINQLFISISNAKSGIVSFKKSIDILPKAERVINKSKRRLSNNLSSLIMILDECISKSQELLKSIL